MKCSMDVRGSTINAIMLYRYCMQTSQCVCVCVCVCVLVCVVCAAYVQ